MDQAGMTPTWLRDDGYPNKVWHMEWTDSIFPSILFMVCLPTDPRNGSGLYRSVSGRQLNSGTADASDSSAGHAASNRPGRATRAALVELFTQCRPVGDLRPPSARQSAPGARDRHIRTSCQEAHLDVAKRANAYLPNRPCPSSSGCDFITGQRVAGHARQLYRRPQMRDANLDVSIHRGASAAGDLDFIAELSALGASPRPSVFGDTVRLRPSLPLCPGELRYETPTLEAFAPSRGRVTRFMSFKYTVLVRRVTIVPDPGRRNLASPRSRSGHRMDFRHDIPTWVRLAFQTACL